MDELEQLKRKLKAWEASFVAENGRKPNKDDILLGPGEIKETYKQYHDLKRISEKSTVDQLPSIDTWSSELNKKAVCAKEEVKKVRKDESFMRSVGKKLLDRAMSMATPKPTRSVKKGPNNASVTLPASSDPKTASLGENDAPPASSIFTKAVSLTRSQPVRVADAGIVGTPHCVRVKKSCFASVNSAPLTGMNSQQTSSLLDDSVDIEPFQAVASSKQSDCDQESNTMIDQRKRTSPQRANQNHGLSEAEWLFSSSENLGKCKRIDDAVDGQEGAVAMTTASKRRLSSDADATKTRKRQKNGFNAEQTLASDDFGLSDSKYPEDTSSEIMKKPAKRKLVAPPAENFVRLNMKLKKYRCRGLVGHSGGWHKRQAWKERMNARAASGGQNACFKCGEAGHWAKNCRGRGRKKADKDGNDRPDPDMQIKVDDADFLSFGEVIQKSRGIKPATDTGSKDPLAANVDLELDVVRTAYAAPVAPPPAEPLYQLEADGSVPPTPKEVKDVLKRFGFTTFRKGQEEVVMRVLCGQSTLVVLSTGAGKSLCYQLPAFLYAQKTKCITLVISPLVSLMDDQVTGLPPGVHGACLHANLSRVQRERVVASIAAGDVHFLLVSPETAVGGGGSTGGLPPPDRMPTIAFACIDEAHCVSEWSHHFRPSYLRICKVLKEKYGVQCMLGLTATATITTAASIAGHIGIVEPERAVIRGRPMPPNLCLSVSRDENKEEALLQLLQGSRFSSCHSIIIYCTRRQQTTRVATIIRTSLQKNKAPAALPAPPTGKTKSGKKAVPVDPEAWTADCYHAGMTASQRRRVQNAFMSGRLRVIVATVAFGMGLDKSDVRGIVHYDMPRRFESYVQEVGRAGRDGITSYCHLFLRPEGKDLHELKRHIYANTIDRSDVKKLVRKVFPRCRCHEANEHQQNQGNKDSGVNSEKSQVVRICPGHERAVPIEKLVQDLDIKEQGIATLLCYLELHKNRWLENLLPVYASCKIQCYGGPMQMQDIARKCPPVGVAIATEKANGISHASCTSLDFNVVELSDRVGWDSGPVKRELKQLQWNSTTEDANAHKSGVVVEFSDLAFHLRSPGDLCPEETDQIIDFLTNFLNDQERNELFQLRHLYETLYRVSHGSVYMCLDEADEQRSEKLKCCIYAYFESTCHPADRQEDSDEAIVPKQLCGDLSTIRADIISFIQTHAHEHVLTGRAIARVFHGIDSPRFPAVVWGRQRRFWRAHLPVEFNVVRKLAEREILNFK